MSEALTLSSLKAVFKFPFQQSDWQNRFLVGSVILLASLMIPIVPALLVYGYILQVMRLAIEGKGLDLPAWDDWGELALDGLRGFLVSLAYMLPGTLIYFGGMILYFVSVLALPILMEVVGQESQLAFALPLLMLASMSIMFLSMLVASLLFLVGVVPLPVAIAHFAAQGEVGAAFRVREWWPLLRINKLGYFVCLVVIVGLMATMYYLVMMFGYCTCCLFSLLMIPAGFYVSLVSAVLLGQTYRESVALLQDSELSGTRSL